MRSSSAASMGSRRYSLRSWTCTAARECAQGRPHRGGVAQRHHNLFDAKLARIHAGMRRSAAAESEDRELARVVALEQRHAADFPRHPAVHDAANSGRGLLDAEPKLARKGGDSVAGGGDVEL